ncbi:nitrite reductase (NAD(P)H) small subunit [Streptomyces sp. NPDC001678]|uniref:nitrite reductase (NAD(P)H) small subunit n=1 Tax=Streptomyces sp. NPDC001678 TaxID=3364599 RepID=UPI0036D0DA1D
MNDHPTTGPTPPDPLHPDARVEIDGTGTDGIGTDGTGTDGTGDDTAWTAVCRYGDLTPGRGVTALVAGRQVAVFRDESGTLYALDNRDPVSGAYVISRGITGSLGGVPVVTSPMYKETYDLRTGVRVGEDVGDDSGEGGDATADRLRTWPVRAVHPVPGPQAPAAPSGPRPGETR